MDLFGEEPKTEESAPVAMEATVVSEEGAALKAPREMDFCLGHDGVEQKILESFNAGRMPHGLIFAGQKGIGKATLAYRVARFLLKYGGQDPNQDSMFDDGPSVRDTLDVLPDDPVFRRVASGGHADFMSVERAFDPAKNKYKASVAVDDIRKVPGFLRMTASDGGWRVVIIDDADTMNRNAQNALLKILEEPPKNALLILVTHRLGALIPTIRSRTQLLNFQPLAQEHILNLLDRQSYDLEPADLKALCLLSEGSVGQAVQYMEEGGLETLGMIMQMLGDYPQWNWSEIHALADNLARPGQDQAYKTFNHLLQWVVSYITVSKAKGLDIQDDSLNYKALRTLMQHSSLEKLLKICENLSAHFTRIERANLDKRQAVLSAFSILAA